MEFLISHIIIDDNAKYRANTNKAIYREAVKLWTGKDIAHSFGHCLAFWNWKDRWLKEHENKRTSSEDCEKM
jgi:hypothetical protein